MKTVLILLGAFGLLHAADLQESNTTSQNFPAAERLNVDNISGAIRVSGYNGSEIQMVAERTIGAESEDRMEAAKREVKLDITRSDNELRIFVDGPFRDHSGDHRNAVHEHEHRGYHVTYNFELKVPYAIALRLATVSGRIQVDGTSGEFDLSDVNGGIDLAEVAGSGHVNTVNGKISATFARNPQAGTSFHTVNGSIEASFRPNLSADIRVKTLHGGAFTDFDTAPLPRTVALPERRDGKFVYRADKSSAMRIGAGGSELSFETVNGSIRILKRGQ